MLGGSGNRTIGKGVIEGEVIACGEGCAAASALHQCTGIMDLIAISGFQADAGATVKGAAVGDACGGDCGILVGSRFAAGCLGK